MSTLIHGICGVMETQNWSHDEPVTRIETDGRIVSVDFAMASKKPVDHYYQYRLLWREAEDLMCMLGWYSSIRAEAEQLVPWSVAFGAALAEKRGMHFAVEKAEDERGQLPAFVPTCFCAIPDASNFLPGHHFNKFVEMFWVMEDAFPFFLGCYRGKPTLEALALAFGFEHPTHRFVH